MKPSQKCKAAGLTGLAELVEITGMKYRTLLYWAKNAPEKFDVLLAGAVSSKPKIYPEYGLPVLIRANGVIQHITYCLDATEDDSAAWFEPYHFAHDDDLVIPVSMVESWVYVDDVLL